MVCSYCTWSANHETFNRLDINSKVKPVNELVSPRLCRVIGSMRVFTNTRDDNLTKEVIIRLCSYRVMSRPFCRVGSVMSTVRNNYLYCECVRFFANLQSILTMKQSRYTIIRIIYIKQPEGISNTVMGRVKWMSHIVIRVIPRKRLCIFCCRTVKSISGNILRGIGVGDHIDSNTRVSGSYVQLHIIL